MEQANCSFQVFDKHPGIYLFLVHPNEMVSMSVRQWKDFIFARLASYNRGVWCVFHLKCLPKLFFSCKITEV